MRFGFVTCVRLGLACMEEIYEIGGELHLVITLPDEAAAEKSGRAYVGEFCLERCIPLLKVDDINSDAAVEAVRSAGIDWLFIIGWSQVARVRMLEASGRGCLGMHPTLLPEGRGRAAIPWAILKGLRKTGVTLFKLDEGVDTGPILAQEVIRLHEREDAGTLYEKVVVAHRILIQKSWRWLIEGSAGLAPQDESKATYWARRDPADGQVRSHMTVAEVDTLVRATTKPYPGAFVELDGKFVRLWSGHPLRGPEPIGRDSVVLTLADGRYVVTRFSLD